MTTAENSPFGSSTIRPVLPIIPGVEKGDGQHFAGTLTRLLLVHLASRGGEPALREVLARAGERRPPEELGRAETWSTYEEFRRLAVAVAEVGGGLEPLTDAGAAVWGSGSLPELRGTLHSVGGPGEVFRVLPQLAAALEPLVDSETEQWAEGDWRIRTRFVDHPPFAEHCALVRGMVGAVPAIFGRPPAAVEEEACQVQGAPACTFHVTWDPYGEKAADTFRAELESRSRVLETRIHALQETVADLVSGEAVDVVLQRIVRAAATALPARGFVLAVDPPSGLARQVFAEGVDGAEAGRCADILLGGGNPESGCTVVDVASRRGRYGRLVALHTGPAELPHQRLVLESYARVAAAALDAAAVIEEATREADMATALLELSLSLSEIGTTEEMAQRLANAVPAVIDCDQVVVALHEPGDHQARIAAARGFGPIADRKLVGRAVPLANDPVGREQVHILTSEAASSPAEHWALRDSAAVASVALRAGGEVLGWVAVVVRDRPERLLEARLLDERLRGLAGQAATAMRNARLVDQIRFQAEHDPLTGLANQRLLADHAEQAIARARRDGARVGLLFLDLDDFKEVNDTLGHAEGDRLLQLVTERLQRTLREIDTVARFGGDEFVVLLPAVTDDGRTVADKIDLVLQERFLLGDRALQISVSIGTAMYPDDGKDFGELLRQADIRMYEAKSARHEDQERRPRT